MILLDFKMIRRKRSQFDYMYDHVMIKILEQKKAIFFFSYNLSLINVSKILESEEDMLRDKFR